LNSHGSHFKRAIVGGMCAENLLLVVYSEKKTVLDLLERQEVRVVQLISKYYYGRIGVPQAFVAILEDISVGYLAMFPQLQRLYKVKG
jgi:5-keto 4-deoxyuronate isomerase